MKQPRLRSYTARPGNRFRNFARASLSEEASRSSGKQAYSGFCILPGHILVDEHDFPYSVTETGMPTWMPGQAVDLSGYPASLSYRYPPHADHCNVSNTVRANPHATPRLATTDPAAALTKQVLPVITVVQE